jgi:hypothetical protein
VSTGAAGAAECAIAAPTAGSSVRRRDRRMIEPGAGGVDEKDPERTSAALTAEARTAALPTATATTAGPAIVGAQQAVVGTAAATASATVAVRACDTILAVAGPPNADAGDGFTGAATFAVAEEYARVPKATGPA